MITLDERKTTTTMEKRKYTKIIEIEKQAKKNKDKMCGTETVMEEEDMEKGVDK